jgi:hypothetical protein
MNEINLDMFDAVYSPTDIIDVSKFPNTKFIFGPHSCLFPNEIDLNLIKGKNSIYIQPSDWPITGFWHNFDSSTKEVRAIPFAFGVDTNTFIDTKPLHEKNSIFIYYKSRKPEELQFIIEMLKKLNIEMNCKIFSYTAKYSEQEYLQHLQNSKYGIWVGTHESQGFGLLEALSCNVPLLVWNVKSMAQEYNYTYDSKFSATTIPYFDNSCGEYFYEMSEFEETFHLFHSRLDKYRPREYVVNHLSIDVCEQRFIDIVNNEFVMN